jgi:formate dehydrogenase subunit delta
MNLPHLVAMANQIGAFFESQPDRDEAVAGIADHLKRFWDPSMREAIIAYARKGANDLKPIVREAVGRLDAIHAG